MKICGTTCLTLFTAILVGGFSGTGTAWADTLEVCPTCEYTTLSAALAAADDHDVIDVGPGIYYGPLEIQGKKITIQGVAGIGDADSTDPTLATIITFDPNGNKTTLILCNGTEDADTVFKNLTFSEAGWNIDGGPGDPLRFGSAIRCLGGSSPTIENCIFEDNKSFDGGGALFIDGGSPTVSGCLFRDNGLDSDDPVDVCVPGLGSLQNSAASAVKIAGGSSQFNDCRFIGNGVMDRPGDAGSGGAACLQEPRGVAFDRCVFHANQSGSGGAVWIEGEASDPPYDSASFNECVFTQNKAFFLECPVDLTTCEYACDDPTNPRAVGGLGGALGSYLAELDITDCIFDSNVAGCPECERDASLTDGFGGGAVGCSLLPPTISGSVFQFNQTMLADGGSLATTGSAIHLERIACSVKTATIDNTKICGNVPTALQVGGACTKSKAAPYTITGGCQEASCIDCLGSGYGSPDCQGDVNGDGTVDAADLGLLIAVWGLCP